MNRSLILFIFIFLFIILYSQIKLLYFVFVFTLLLFLLYLSYRDNQLPLFLVSFLFLLALLPSLSFYLDLCYGVYPYLFYEQNKQDQMKKYCNDFLRRHFKVIEINKDISTQHKPVIFLVNHHTSESKILDYFGILTIPGKNRIVVTGGKTRWRIIDNLYSNLYTIKLTKNTTGNLDMFLESCYQELARGNNLIIFPEGKYSNKKKTWRKLEKLQTGAFILSKKFNVPIIPVIISGNSHQYGFLTGDNLVIKYLEVIYPSSFSNSEDMREYSLKSMNKGLETLN